MKKAIIEVDDLNKKQNYSLKLIYVKNSEEPDFKLELKRPNGEFQVLKAADLTASE